MIEEPVAYCFPPPRAAPSKPSEQALGDDLCAKLA
jgi:hypothetical protein